MKSIIYKIKHAYDINENLVSSLYNLSKYSLLVLIAFVIIVVKVLYPILQNNILIWGILLISISIYRLYHAFYFEKNKTKYSLEIWYKKFLIHSILTAFLASILGFYFMHGIDKYSQLFIIASLLGLSAGSVASLRPDARISMAYITIIIIPLIFALLFTETGTKNYAIAFLFLLLYISLLFMLLKAYNENKKYTKEKEEKVHLKNIFKEAPLGIFSYDTKLNIVDANKQISVIFNNYLTSYNNFNLRDLKDKRLVEKLLKTLTKGAQTYKGAYKSLNGKEYWIEMNSFSYTDSLGNVIGGVGIMEDKTKEHAAQENFKFQSTHDTLTPLLNRRGFKNYIDELVLSQNHEAYYSLLFYLDLDQFKGINDSLGHAIGDEILLAISGRLLGLLGATSTICRLGGDEFVIIIPFVASNIELATLEATTYAEKIQSIFEDHFIIDDIHLFVKSSIGIVIIDPNYTDTKEIIRQADMSMYQAKNTNVNIVFYNKEMDKKQKELFALQHDLAFACKNNEFELFYQPIFELSSNKLYSAEMLIRWQHPTRGILSPDEFIPLAVKAGILSTITWWLLDKVCQDIVFWKEKYMWKLNYVSININAQQLVEHNFTEKFIDKLESYGLQATDIMIEITEQSIIDNFTYAQNVIDSLREHGVRCAIDDFGVGYSSLAYLKKLSFDTLKIDKEFIKKDASDTVLLKSILDIGKHYNYNIIIEGVETEEQKNMLIDLGHDVNYQGYLISKPITNKKFYREFLA